MSLMNDSIELNFDFALENGEQELFKLLREAKESGLRAGVLKNDKFGTGAIAKLANLHSNGAVAFGGVCLDRSINGFNAAVVAEEAKLGSKLVWMPTYSALNDLLHKKSEEDMEYNTLSPIDNSGKLLPEVLDILSIVQENNMVLATGHLSRNEIFILVKAAINMGIHRVLVNRVLSNTLGTRLSIEAQIELAEMGAFIDYCWLDALDPDQPTQLAHYCEGIRSIGAEKCVLTSVFGADKQTAYPEMYDSLMSFGITEDEIETMVKHNTQYLLDI